MLGINAMMNREQFDRRHAQSLDIFDGLGTAQTKICPPQLFWQYIPQL